MITMMVIMMIITKIIMILYCREFYYIQMEKYARQALSEGVKNSEEIRVSGDSELYRVLNLHYNRNNHIEVRTKKNLSFYRITECISKLK